MKGVFVHPAGHKYNLGVSGNNFKLLSTMTFYPLVILLKTIVMIERTIASQTF
ncbi:MAG: hypothetical protein JWQ38_2984 [Flavipsychrobacter sp.]|nr:hypothetical protein [Flavipsychrobacter sp.]